MSDGPDDSDDDPFEAFDVPEDADPFDDLQGPESDTESEDDRPSERETGPDMSADPVPAENEEQTPPGRMAEDPFSGESERRDGADAPFGGGETTADASPESATTDDKAGPAEDLFSSFSGAGNPTGPGDDPFSAFESVGVDDVDPDVVWESLASAESDGMPEFDEKVYYEVSKHKFCERCEYFSGPPETNCTYEGAAIVEFLDMETVRLLNCPVVAEQRELEESVGNIGSE